MCRVWLDWIAGFLSPDCGFGLSSQFIHFDPNPKIITFLIKKVKFLDA